MKTAQRPFFWHVFRVDTERKLELEYEHERVKSIANGGAFRLACGSAYANQNCVSAPGGTVFFAVSAIKVRDLASSCNASGRNEVTLPTRKREFLFIFGVQAHRVNRSFEREHTADNDSRAPLHCCTLRSTIYVASAIDPLTPAYERINHPPPLPPPMRTRSCVLKQVPSFALVTAALMSFPPRALSTDVGRRSPDPCATRLPALANSTLTALVRCGTMAEQSVSPVPPPPPPLLSGLGSNGVGGFFGGAGAGVGAGAGGGVSVGILKPLADSLSPYDAYRWRQALVASASEAVKAAAGRTRGVPTGTSSSQPEGDDDAVADEEFFAAERSRLGAEAVEESRAAALDLLLAAVTYQPALMVVLFWAPAPPAAATPSSTPKESTGGMTDTPVASDLLPAPGAPPPGERGVGGGGAALADSVLSILNSLAVEREGAPCLVAGAGEALGKALDLVLALWHAEGVGRLGQV